MTPASGLCPERAAKSTVLRSIATNIAPMNRYTGISTTRPGAASRARLAGLSGRRRRRRWRSVDGDDRRLGRPLRREPQRPRQSAQGGGATPAAGYSWVASRVTAAGPITKHSSSATDSTENAVCSRGDPASRADQRARAIGPVCGMVAPPAMPQANSVQSGARSATAADSPATDSAKVTHTGMSTRCWPSRSASRPSCGAHTAPPIDPAADTLPARP